MTKKMAIFSCDRIPSLMANAVKRDEKSTSERRFALDLPSEKPTSPLPVGQQRLDAFFPLYKGVTEAIRERIGTLAIVPR